MLPKLLRLGFYGLMALILVLSLLPLQQPEFSPNDKVNHLLGYGSLMLMGYLAYRRIGWIAMAVFCFGVLIEGLQGLTPYRMLSLADVVANSAGIVLAVLVILFTKMVISVFNKKGSKTP